LAVNEPYNWGRRTRPGYSASEVFGLSAFYQPVPEIWGADTVQDIATNRWNHVNLAALIIIGHSQWIQSGLLDSVSQARLSAASLQRLV